MGEQLIFTEAEAKFLRELARRKVKFMIVGLSAAALQGAPVVTQDVDLWFANLDDPRIRQALKKVGGAYVPPVGTNPPMLAGDAVDMFDIVVHMHGLGDFCEEEKDAVSVLLGRTRLKVLSLPQIIRSKKALNRKKDRLALPVLADALKTTGQSKHAAGEHARHRGGMVKHRGNRG